jgi:hypothetical protein
MCSVLVLQLNPLGGNRKSLLCVYIYIYVNKYHIGKTNRMRPHRRTVCFESFCWF